MKGANCLRRRGLVEFVVPMSRIVLPVLILRLLGGCASAPTASLGSYDVDRLDGPRLPVHHTYTIGVFNRVLANSHPMLELWRDMTFGRLLKNPQSWLMERERLGLAKSESREDAIEENLASPGFGFDDVSIFSHPLALLPYQIMAIDSQTSRSLSVAAFDVNLYPMRSQVAILPIVSFVDASNGSTEPLVFLDRVRSMLFRGDQVETGMRFCGIVFLLLVLLTPALCSLCASNLLHPIRRSPTSVPIAPARPILTISFLQYSS